MNLRPLVCFAFAFGACITPPPPPTDAPADLGPDDASALDALPMDAQPMDVQPRADAVDRCDPRLRLADGGNAFNIADGCALPNLIPAIGVVQIQTRTFAPGACEVMEGCTMAGRRRLLRFDLNTPNIGAGDLYVGPPVANNRPDGRFEYGACHGHYHFRGYADYSLRSTDGREVGMGHKQSFCLLDTGMWMGMGREVPIRDWYRCTDQGIHAGWYDLYERSLDCQYVDITDVPPGQYDIRVRINQLRTLPEANYDDNETTMRVTIPATDPVAMTVNPTDACPSDMNGATRDCGWFVDRTSTCVANEMVTVGCNAMCSPALGDCVGTPVMRVCPGDGPCVHADALAENTGACGTSCPQVTFRCPASVNPRFTVLTAGARSGGPYECRVAVAGR